METHLWICPEECFQKGSTKDGGTTLDVGGTIPWAGILD